MIILIISIFILITFWLNSSIEIKPKIILTILFLALRFLLPGLAALITSTIVLIVMALMLRWNGVNL